MKGMISQRFKSLTYWLGLTAGILGVVQVNMPMVAEYLGDKAGLVNIGLMIAIFLVRELTTKPLSEK